MIKQPNTKGVEDLVKGGGFDIASMATSVAPMLTGVIDGVTGGKGGYALKGAISGAAAGTSVLPGVGTLVGAGLGALGGLFKKGQDEKVENDMFDQQRKAYSKLDIQANINPEGNYYEDGGYTGEQQTQQPQDRLLNIEMGELMIDPMNMNVVREFKNPNRYAPHNKNQFKEAKGNFVAVPNDKVIVPKKLAERYKKGDILTRKSIVLQLLSNQAINPNHNTPNVETPQYENGGVTSFDDSGKKRKKNNTTVSNNYQIYSGIVDGAGNHISNPTYDQAIKNMVDYMKNNNSPLTDKPSNVYRDEFQHHSINNPEITPIAANGGLTDIGELIDDSTLMLPKPKNQIVKKIGENNIIPQQAFTDKTGLNLTKNSLNELANMLGDINIPQIKNRVSPKVNLKNVGSDIANPLTDTKTASKFNIGKAGRTLMQDLPIYAQMFTNSLGDPYLGENTNAGYSDAIGLANQLPEDINIEGNLAANNRSFNTALKTIDNNDTPSLRAEKSQLLAEKFAGDNSIYQNRENVKNGLKASKLQTLLGLEIGQGQDFQQDRRFLMQEQRMDKAARENNTGAALSNLSKNKQLAQNDAERIKALNAMTNSVNIDPLSSELIKEDPNFMSYIYDFMLSGKGDYNAAKANYTTEKTKKKNGK